MRENEVLHSEAMAPALELLLDPAYESANQEFMAALEDYRKDDFEDCLTKCGSAFESVLKVLCAKNRWPHDDHDTARRLISILIEKTDLDGFFADPLIIVATLRNRKSSAHGGGTKPRLVPRHYARFGLNATASAILLVVDEAGR